MGLMGLMGLIRLMRLIGLMGLIKQTRSEMQGKSFAPCPSLLVLFPCC